MTAEKQAENVRRIFNDMANEYDRLDDLWYPYTFAKIDQVLRREFQIPRDNLTSPLAIDVGCGTGIQSLRLASMGYRVIGVDVSEKALNIARAKLDAEGYRSARFQIADAQALPFDNGAADCVNCVGPTLSFVPDWRRALAEMSRCLKPNGKLLLEVDARWNLDMIWGVINALGFNLLGYDEPLSTALSHFLPPWRRGITVNYSFRSGEKQAIKMPLRLFTVRELMDGLERVGLTPERRWGLHAVTNLLPSTVMHRANPSPMTRRAFSFLAAIEKRIDGLWPANVLANSLLIQARK